LFGHLALFFSLTLSVGYVLGEFRASGLITNPLVHVEVSQDGEIIFAGVYKGMTALLAWDMKGISSKNIKNGTFPPCSLFSICCGCIRGGDTFTCFMMTPFFFFFFLKILLIKRFFHSRRSVP
jgi:hypothetical protein